MNKGFSPYQLVYGRNPKLPCVLDDNPPALENTTISSTFGKHPNALHTARRAFMMSETSEKIKCTLRHRVRPSGKEFSKDEYVPYIIREMETMNGRAWVSYGSIQ